MSCFFTVILLLFKDRPASRRGQPRWAKLYDISILVELKVRLKEDSLFLVFHARTLHCASDTSLLNETVSIVLGTHHTHIFQDIVRRKFNLDALDLRGEHLAAHR